VRLRACIHRLYRNVYDRSTLQFDRLTRDFFDAVLTDAELDGRVFLYRHDGRLIGFNLCVVFNGALVDKYVGFEYPAARRHNLYCVSWMQNLDYAAANGLSHFIAGCAAPAIKADLGASFTFTRHAVYARNALLRAALRRLAGRFEGDRAWFDGRTRAAGSP
jgi:predicted N-acyltransferase